MSPIQPASPQQIADVISQIGHNKLLGISWHGASDDGEEPWVELRLPWDDRLIGDPVRGVIASGPIIALMDMTTALSAWQAIGGFRPIATLDLRVDYLRAAPSGSDVFGRATCYRHSRSIAFVRGIAHVGDAADPIAHVAGTYMFTGDAA